jgi:branched-chain amino acid transport system substrate-binding protein
MKKWIGLLLVVFLLCSAIPLLGCSEEVEKEAYKVGAVFAVSGFNAPLGTPEKQTVEMMVQQINAAGGIDGHPLEVTIYDTESDTTKCVTLVNSLIEDGVVAIIGPSSTGESMALIDVVTGAEIPLVSCAAGVTIVTPVQDREWVFKTPQSDLLAVRELFKYIEQVKGFTKIAIISDTGGFGKGGKAILEAQAASYGLEIVANEDFDTTQADMTAELASIKGSTAEAIVCWGTNPGPALIAQSRKALNMTIPLYCSHGIANMKFIELGGDAVNGVIFPAGKLLVAGQLLDSDPQKDVLVEYKADFEAKYGAGTANTFGGHAYDALSMVVMALDKVGPDKAKIRDYIESITDFPGTGGVFNMSVEDHNGLVEGCFVMIEIVNGEWTWLQ